MTAFLGSSVARGLRTLRGSTAENFACSDTPSLAGLWLMNEGSGETVIDHSAYGQNLIIELSSTDVGASSEDLSSIQEAWSYKQGYLSLSGTGRATCSVVGNPLADNSKTVMSGFDLLDVIGDGDGDIGTMWDIVSGGIGDPGDPLANTFKGWSFPYSPLSVSFRIGRENPSSPPFIQLDAIPTSVSMSANTQAGVVGYDEPGTEKGLFVNGEASIATEANTWTREGPQRNKFGIQSTTLGSNAFSIRKVQVWCFDSRPDELEAAMKLIAANPGVLPKWWEGR